MGSIKDPQNAEQIHDYRFDLPVTLTPVVLYGKRLALEDFYHHPLLTDQVYDITLLNRILSQAFQIDKPPKQWRFSLLCHRDGLAIHYAYPTPNDRLYFDCRNDDMPLHIKADSRLIGIAATIIYHVYCYVNSQHMEQKQRHKDLSRHLRDYCQYLAGSQEYDTFNQDLFEMLMVNFPPAQTPHRSLS